MSCLYSSGAGRRQSFLRFSLSAAALGAGMLAAGPAAADSTSANVRSFTSRSIVVQSDGSAYTEVATTSYNITGEIAVDVDAGHVGRVVSYFAEPWLRVGNLDSPDLYRYFGDSGHGKTYSRPRPKKVRESFGFAISRQRYADFVVEACNWHADSLRGQGLSNSQIFGQDRKIDIWVAASIEAEMSGPDVAGTIPPGQIDGGEKVTVTCQQAPQVEAATLVARAESSLRGGCSVNLSGTIRTNLPNTAVSYRYHSDDGRKSEVRAVQTNASGTAQVSHDYPLSEGDVRSGKIRIVGENFDFTSDWADYEVDCRGPAQGYASNDPTPPDLTMDIGIARENLYEGFICPATVSLDTWILADDRVEGRVVHIAAQQAPVVEPEQQVSEFGFWVAKGQKIAAGASFDLKWSNVPVVGANPPWQAMKFSFQFVRHHTVIAETEKTVVLSCRKPETLGDSQGAPGGLGSTAPKAPDLSLSVATTGEKTVGSFACPATLTATAKITPNDAMDLVIAHHLEQPSVTIGQGSQAKEQTVSLQKSQNYTTFPQSFDLNWQGLHAAAGQPLRQPVKMTVRLARDGFVVAEEQKELVLECEGSVAEPPALPPQAVRLHAYEVEHTRHRGLSCPAKVEIHGVLDGRGTTSGTAALFADGEPKALRQ